MIESIKKIIKDNLFDSSTIHNNDSLEHLTFQNNNTRNNHNDINNRTENNKEETKPTLPIMPEVKMINNFVTLTNSLMEHENFPNKAKSGIESMITILKEIDFDNIDYSEQALIKTILEKDLPSMIKLYLELPKAHAVSVIIENNKTSKDNFIDKIFSYVKVLNQISLASIDNKTKALLKEQKKETVRAGPKKDFFDL